MNGSSPIDRGWRRAISQSNLYGPGNPRAVVADLTLPLAVFVGWVVGMPLALAARLLAAEPGSTGRQRGWRLIAVDPALQAFQALTLAALALRFGLSWQLAIYGALNLILTLIFFIDL